MQKKIILLMTLFCSFCSWAAETRDAVKIWKANESMGVYYLGERPHVSFSKGDLVFATEKTTLTLPMDERLTFTFVAYGTDAVASLEVTDPVFDFSGENIAINGLVPSSAVSVYDVQGKCLFAGTVDQNGALVIQGLSKSGIFIVKTNSSTFKIIRK